MNEEDVYFALTERLAQHYDPFLPLGFTKWPSLGRVLRYPDRKYINMAGRDMNYHLGRLAYFVRLLKSGESLTPIEVDNRCDNSQVYPEAIILDGHHRFGASLLVNEPKIPISYGGCIDVLEWLIGVRTQI